MTARQRTAQPGRAAAQSDGYGAALELLVDRSPVNSRVNCYLCEPMREDESPSAPPRSSAPTQIAETVSRTFFRTDSNSASLKRDIRRWLLGAVWSPLLIPSLFYLR